MPTEHPALLGAGCSVPGVLFQSLTPRRRAQTLLSRGRGTTGATVPLLCSLGTNTEEASQEPRGFFNPSLALSAPGGHPQARCPQGGHRPAPQSLRGAPSSHHALAELQLPSPDPLISCNTESVLKPLQKGSVPPSPPAASATFPVTLVRALSINQGEMKASWGYITTPWEGMKAPL